VQNLRKERGLAVTDRIRLALYGSDRLKAAWEAFAGSVAAETLAVEVVWEKAAGGTELEAGEEKWLVSIEIAKQ
jgi:isoleucyl-tRNA synthetase